MGSIFQWRNTWSSSGNLPASAVGGLSSISADIDQNDNIYIVWKSGNFSLGFARFNGSTWSPTYTINTTTQTSSDSISFSQISVDRKGIIYIMWQQGNHQNYNPGIKSTCWYARSTDGTGTLKPEFLMMEVVRGILFLPWREAVLTMLMTTNGTLISLLTKTV